MSEEAYYLFTIAYLLICAVMVWLFLNCKKRRVEMEDGGKPILATLSGPLIV